MVTFHMTESSLFLVIILCLLYAVTESIGRNKDKYDKIVAWSLSILTIIIAIGIYYFQNF